MLHSPLQVCIFAQPNRAKCVFLGKMLIEAARMVEW